MEKRDRRNEGLLERLAEETGCIYMSDLRGTIMKDRCLTLLSKIETKEYSEVVWRDAANYMTGKKGCEDSAEEAKQRILRFLGVKENNI